MAVSLTPPSRFPASSVGPELTDLPRRLQRDLRSDHAGETGAVCIYRGVLAVARDPDVRRFALHHMATESEHLALMEDLVGPAHRSRLLPLWRVAGWLTGALPALFGPRAVYVTIDAVESFVDLHYRAQLEALDAAGDRPVLRSIIARCRLDELEHRDEARAAAGERGLLGRAWARVVGIGSWLGVLAARRL